MNFAKILFEGVEMILFIGASIYVTNEYIKGGSNLEMFFGLFLLLIFVNQVMKTAKEDSKIKSSEKKTMEKVE